MSREKAEIKTVIVNAFGGPGAGKTTAAWEIAAELKKRGLCVEYVSEYAKELVWENRMDLLDGSLKHQSMLFVEQRKRVDRLNGQCDVVVTDSPLLLNLMYCKNCPKDYEDLVLKIHNEYNNFNFFVDRGEDRGESFEQRGRIHNLTESMQKDKEIKGFLEKHKVFYGEYTHERVGILTNNIEKHWHRINDKSWQEEKEKPPKFSVEKKGIRIYPEKERTNIKTSDRCL